MKRFRDMVAAGGWGFCNSGFRIDTQNPAKAIAEPFHLRFLPVQPYTSTINPIKELQQA